MHHGDTNVTLGIIYCTNQTAKMINTKLFEEYTCLHVINSLVAKDSTVSYDIGNCDLLQDRNRLRMNMSQVIL